MHYFPRVLRYLKPYWRLATISALLIGVATVLGLLAPWPMKILLDHVLDDKPLSPMLSSLFGAMGDHRQGLLLAAVLGGLGLTALQNAIKVLDTYVNTKIDQGMALDFRSDLFQHAQHLTLAFHD